MLLAETPPVMANPSPQLSLARRTSPQTVEAESLKPAPLALEPPLRRFRVEASAFTADRQPSSASRLAVQTVSGHVEQRDGQYVSLSPVPSGPPLPFLPGTPDPYGTLVNGVVSASGDGPQASIKSWSSGLNLAVSFSPRGAGVAGWRWTARLSRTIDDTKSDTAFPPAAYERDGPAAISYGCLGQIVFSGFITRYYGCSWVQSFQGSFTRYQLPSPLQLSDRGLRTTVLADHVTQSAEQVDGHLAGARDFSFRSPLGRLTVSAGGEIGVGRWSIDEHELIRSTSNIDIYRSAKGPTGMAELTAGLAGPIGRGKALRWSIRSALGYQLADLKMVERAHDDYPGTAITTTNPSAETLKQRNTETTGRLGVRLDYARGPMGLFLALDRRRDPSLVSSVTAPGSNGRASKVFGDGSAMTVWPVYSSRLTAGLNYDF